VLLGRAAYVGDDVVFGRAGGPPSLRALWVFLAGLATDGLAFARTGGKGGDGVQERLVAAACVRVRKTSGKSKGMERSKGKEKRNKAKGKAAAKCEEKWMRSGDDEEHIGGGGVEAPASTRASDVGTQARWGRREMGACSHIMR
jgi:hypothetical protein